MLTILVRVKILTDAFSSVGSVWIRAWSKGDPLPRSFQPVPSSLGMGFESKYFSERRRPLAVLILQQFEQLAVVRAQRCFAL